MDIEKLSTKYKVLKIKDDDIDEVFELCKNNPLYYEHYPPFVTHEIIRQEMIVLPDGKSLEDKYYIGFWDKDTLIAVMDLIDKYPNDDTVYVGFFMMNADFQGLGIGSSIIYDIVSYLKTKYKYARLGYVKSNEQSKNFWLKNGFSKIYEVDKENIRIVVCQKTLVIN